MDLTTLLVWLAKNRSIRHLSLGKNFNNIKSKWATHSSCESLHSSPMVFNELIELLTALACLFPQKCVPGSGQPGSHDSGGGLGEGNFLSPSLCLLLSSVCTLSLYLTLKRS